jgi:hypothetical protein
MVGRRARLPAGDGTLDSINSMSCEQFAIDAEIWVYLRRLAARPSVDAGTLAVEVVAALPVDYLGVDHTMEHLAAEMAACSRSKRRSGASSTGTSGNGAGRWGNGPCCALFGYGGVPVSARCGCSH